MVICDVLLILSSYFCSYQTLTSFFIYCAYFFNSLFYFVCYAIFSKSCLGCEFGSIAGKNFKLEFCIARQYAFFFLKNRYCWNKSKL